MKRNLILILALLVLCGYTIQKDNKPFLNLPETDCTVLVRTGYTLCYNTNTKVATWATYTLNKLNVDGESKRSNNFHVDLDIPAGKRSEVKDYDNSGFDRGHLVPANDMKLTEQTMDESFLMTNMSPQLPRFNRGIWKALEFYAHEQAESGKELLIIDGPIYLKGEHEFIGINKVEVPDLFYKVIFESPFEIHEAKAYVIPNMEDLDSDFSKYQVDLKDLDELLNTNSTGSLEVSNETSNG